jgi:hypothetical protein
MGATRACLGRGYRTFAMRRAALRPDEDSIVNPMAVNELAISDLPWPTRRMECDHDMRQQVRSFTRLLVVSRKSRCGRPLSRLDPYRSPQTALAAFSSRLCTFHLQSPRKFCERKLLTRRLILDISTPHREHIHTQELERSTTTTLSFKYRNNGLHRSRQRRWAQS